MQHQGPQSQVEVLNTQVSKQAEQWLAMGSRCARRASRVYTRIIADCNPDSNLHWTLKSGLRA